MDPLLVSSTDTQSGTMRDNHGVCVMEQMGVITDERTTTMGDSEFVTRHKAFHIIKPEATIDRKLSTWNRS